MQTHPKTRIDIVIEQAALSRLTGLLDLQKGINGYAVQGGRGTHGVWTRDGQVSDADGMMLVMCVLDSQHKDALLENVFPFIEKRAGFVTISEVDVIRSERF